MPIFSHCVLSASVSVSFRSYLFSNGMKNYIKILDKIVSVSFRSYLFSNYQFGYDKGLSRKQFPSPFGVICSLILKENKGIEKYQLVSVSFRSYLFSNVTYLPYILRIILFPSPFGVICSLILLL